MARLEGSQDIQKRKSRLGTIAKVGAGATALGASGYGASVGYRTYKDAKAYKNVGRRVGLTQKAGPDVKTYGSLAKSQVESDVRRAKSGFNKAVSGTNKNAKAFGAEVKSGFKGTRNAIGRDIGLANNYAKSALPFGQKVKRLAGTGTGKAAIAAGALGLGAAGLGIAKMIRDRNKNKK